MNKSELINRIATEASITKTDAGKALDAFIDVVKKTLSSKDEVTLVGFGTFAVRDRAARTGRNPQTGKELKIAATTVPVFRPGKTLKEDVNK